MKLRLPSKDARKIVEYAESKGFTASLTKASHIKLTHTSGAVVFCSGTPSDWRAKRKIEADIDRVLRTGKV